jgi:hypothetical protein
MFLSGLSACGSKSVSSEPSAMTMPPAARDVAARPTRPNNTIRNIIGKYKVERCNLADARGAQKAYITVVKPDFRGRKPELAIEFYSASTQGATGDMMIPLGRGTRKFLGADGNEIWNTRISENVVLHHFTFDRKGSDTWPDLHYEYTTAITRDQVSKSLMITYQRENKPPQNCSLISLADSREDAKIGSARRLKQGDLETFAKHTESDWAGDLDFDQASMHIKRLRFETNGAATEAQISEAIRLKVIGTNIAELKSKPVTREHLKMAQAAMKTIIGLHEEGEAADKRIINKFVKSIADFLRAHGSKFKVHQIEWNESDSDGEGLFFIDEQNGQAFYVGAGYYS